MKPTICYIDETEYWTELPKHCKKIYGAYLIDKERAVHCCSITPSYEAWYLGSVPIMSGGDEKHIWDAEGFIRDNDTSDKIAYFNMNSTFEEEYFLYDEETPDTDEEYVEKMEEIIEYINSNGEMENGLML